MEFKFNKHIPIAALIIFLLFLIFNQSAIAQYSPWTSFNTAHGLGDVEVYTIYESPTTGDLWFGTRNGATRYNGSMKKFISESAFLTGKKVYAIAENSASLMWFGTDMGLQFLQNEKLMPGFDTLKHSHIWAITKDDSLNNWWFATSYGAFQYRPDSSIQWRKHLIPGDSTANDVRDILIDKDGHIWLGTFQGLYCMDSNGELIGTYLESSIISDIFKDRVDSLWIATNGEGAFKFSKGIMAPVGSGSIAVRLSAITQDWEGKLYITSCEHGVYSSFDGKTKWDILTSRDGLSHDAVYDVEEDCFRNLWFATRYNGITRYERSWQTYLSSNTPTTSNDIFSLEKDNNGNIWAGLNDDGIYKFNGKDFEKKYPPGKSQNYDIYCIESGTDSTLWFGTKDQGLLKFDGVKWDSKKKPQYPIGSNWILSILKDSHDELWFGCKNGGVTWFQTGDSVWVPYTTDSGLVNNTVKDIYEDKQGLIWFATNEGVSCFDREKRKFVDIDSINFPGYNYNSITADDNDNLWFSTQDHGVIKYDRSGLEYYQTDDGLASSQIHVVRFDSINKKFWFGSDRGINYLKLMQDQNMWQLFTKSNSGISDSWTNAILIVPDLKKTDTGQDTLSVLWFGTKNGIARYLGEVLPPETYIEKPEKDNHIFVTAIPAFEVLGRDNVSSIYEISYSYLISKIDSLGTKQQLFGGWSEFSFINPFTPPGVLENGSYEIQVRSRDSENNIDPSPAKRKFKIDQLLMQAQLEASKENYLFTSDNQRQVKIYLPPNAVNKSIRVQINTLIDTIVTPDIQTFFKFEIFALDKNNNIDSSLILNKLGTISIRDAVNILRHDRNDTLYPALYHKFPGSCISWEYIGGTADFNLQTLSAPFKSFGQYAVGYGKRTKVKAIITELNCRPRIFSTRVDNPSNNTIIIFKLGEISPVTIKIFNVAGRLIRSLKTEELLFSGEHAVCWDGKNDDNENCVSGLYIICVVVKCNRELITVAIVNK